MNDTKKPPTDLIQRIIDVMPKVFADGNLTKAFGVGLIEAGKWFGPHIAFCLGFSSHIGKVWSDEAKRTGRSEGELRKEAAEALKGTTIQNLEDRLGSVEDNLRRAAAWDKHTRRALAVLLKVAAGTHEFVQGQAPKLSALLEGIADLRDLHIRERRSLLEDMQISRMHTREACLRLESVSDEFSAKMKEMLEQLADPTKILDEWHQKRINEIEKSYLKEIEAEYGEMKLVGVRNMQKILNINPAFVTLSLADSKLSDGRGLRADELLASMERVVIVGPAGSGKTTLLQWEMLQCIGSDGPRDPDSGMWGGVVPFFLRFRKFAPGEAFPNPERWVPLSVETPLYTTEQYLDWVREILNDGRALLFFDGLDELPDRLRKKFWEELQNFSKRRNVAYRVSSRPFYRTPPEKDGDGASDPSHAGEWDPPKRDPIVDILPLSDQQVDQLIERWHSAASQGADSTDGDDPVSKAKSLKQKLRLRKYHRVRQLARTPFFCSAICLIHSEPEQKSEPKRKLPTSRHGLLEELCKALLVYREYSREAKPDVPYNELKPEDLYRIHAGLAWNMLTSPNYKSLVSGEDKYRIEAERDVVLSWLREMIPHIKNDVIRCKADQDMDSLVKHMVEKRGLLRQPSKDKLDFHHRSIQDYLAASWAGKNRLENFLVDRAGEHRWRDVIVLAPGGLLFDDKESRNRFANLLVEGLLDRAQQENSRICYGLAAGCMDVDLDLSEKIRQRVVEGLKSIIPPGSYSEVEDVVAAGDAAVPLLLRDNISTNDERILAYCTLALMLIGGQVAMDALDGYSGDHDVLLRSVVRAPGVDVLRIPQVFEAVGTNGAIPELGLSHIENLSALRELTDLRSLDLTDCARIRNLTPVSALINLDRLHLQGCASVSDMRPLAALRQLRELSLAECAAIGDFSHIRQLTDLESLDLSRCPQIEDLSFLEGLTNLKRLGLRGCSKVKSLAPLAKLQQLERLDLGYCDRNLDLSPLQGLSNLPGVKDSGGVPLGTRDLLGDACSGVPLGTRDLLGILSLPMFAETREPGKDYVETAFGAPILMVWIPGGTFEMGSPDNEEDRSPAEGPVQTVTLGGFWMSSTLVTQAQYESVCKENPSHFKGDDQNNLPVEQVSWKDAVEFCRYLSQKTKHNYTLPTEAQWEYACRSGSRTKYCYGDDPERLEHWAWYTKNSDGKTHPVAGKRPNAWGLYDMHGNLWEWCQDCWHDSYKGAPTDGSAWESSSEKTRVLRGGSWDDYPRYCRSAFRDWYYPVDCGLDLGFRFTRTP